MDFFDNRFKVIYDAILSLNATGKPFDKVTIIDELDRTGQLGDAGKVGWINEILRETSNEGNVREHALIVRRCSLERKAKAAGDKDDYVNLGNICNEINNLWNKNAINESPEGLPPDYISASSLWNESFERYWLIENLIQRGRVYELFGRYKGGKTLVAIDMVCHLTAGTAQWAGRQIAPVFVIWIAGEAVEDVKERIAAWLRHNNVTKEIPLYIRVKPAHMDKTEFAQRVGQEVATLQSRNPDLMPLVVIDTVARNLSPGCDENTGPGLGAFINNTIDHVVTPNKAAAICVHHPGHGDPDRGRGHSSFPGAVDGIIKVTMDKSSGDSIITVSTSESRNTAGKDSFSFSIETQEIPGQDNFGNPIDAPVLRYLEDYTPAKSEKLGKDEQLALEVIERMQRDISGTTPNVTDVAVTDWRSEFYATVRKNEPEIKQDTLRKNWNRAINGLKDKGKVTLQGINNTRASVTAGHKRDNVTVVTPGHTREAGTDGTHTFRNLEKIT